MKDELLIKYLLKETTEDENLRLEEWLAAHPDHQKEYEQMKWVWESSKAGLQQSDVDENQAWEKFKSRKDRASPVIRLFPKWLRAVAAAVALVITSLVALSFLPHSGRAYFAEVILEAGENSEKEVLLDGSLVTLNKNSKLSYSQKIFSGERRVHLLAGEVYFEVERDEQRPFHVHAGDLTVKVLGTSFNVKMDKEQAQVILDQGSVGLEWEGAQVVLKPGEKASANLLTKQLETIQVGNGLHRYYVNNKFEARQLPLYQIIEALNDAYDADITIASEGLGQQRITTTLEYGSLDQNLEVIKETLGIRISGEGKRRVLH
jgi:transmembrane sensor